MRQSKYQHNVLITGANGFVGQALADQLDKKNVRLVRVVRRLGSVSHPEQYTVSGDIHRFTDWGGALLGVGVVVHLAARVHVMNDSSPFALKAYREVNVKGTLNLARQAAVSNVRRFIYLSSIKVNGEETIVSPFTEEDHAAPRDPYGQSKLEAEKGLFEIASQTGLEVVIVRPPLIYGPGVKANFYNMIHWLSKGIPLPLGRIHNKRSLVALENLVDLIVTCIEHPAATNQVFLAGDGEDLSTSELLQRLGTALGKPARLLPIPQGVLEFGLKMLGKGDVAQKLCGSLQVDISKARDMLSWNPPVNVDEGFQKTVDWYMKERFEV